MPEDQANPPQGKCYIPPTGGTLVKWREPRAYYKKIFSIRDCLIPLLLLIVALAFFIPAWREHFNKGTRLNMLVSAIFLFNGLFSLFGAAFGFLGRTVRLKDDYLLTGFDYNMRIQLPYDDMASCSIRFDSFKEAKFAVLTFAMKYRVRRLGGTNILKTGAPVDARLDRMLTILRMKGVNVTEEQGGDLK
jgi:hypothetical protein